MRAFIKTSIPIATDGQMESAQISIFVSALHKKIQNCICCIFSAIQYFYPLRLCIKGSLLTKATVVDDAIRFVSNKSKENLKSSPSNDNEAEKESREHDYDKNEDQLEEKQEDETTQEITATTNQIF